MEHGNKYMIRIHGFRYHVNNIERKIVVSERARVINLSERLPGVKRIVMFEDIKVLSQTRNIKSNKI